MEFLLFFLLSMLGASIGSFIGAEVWREQNNVISKRSVCDNCKQKLSWYRLVPIFSSILSTIQKKSCKNCDYKIPVKYLVLEFLSGFFLVILTIFLIEQNYLADLFSENYLVSVQVLVSSLTSYFLIKLAYEDYLSREISSSTTYVFFGFSVLMMLMNLFLNNQFLAYSISLILVAPFFVVSFISKEKALGMGDPIVLLSALLLFSSFSYSSQISIFLYTIWAGALIGVFYIVYNFEGYEKGVQLPFTPFILLGTSFLLITRYYVFELSDILLIWHAFFG